MTMNMNQAAPSKFGQDMAASMKKMNDDMASAPKDGDVDHDFVTMMIPHHQGAVAMAQGELDYGKDPAMRQLAGEIIAAQKVEIKSMNLWLKEHAAETAK